MTDGDFLPPHHPWADYCPPCLARQHELGRDTSEYKPEIRLRWEQEKRIAAYGWQDYARAARRPSGSDYLDDCGPVSHRPPWYRRAWLTIFGGDRA